MPGTPPSPPTVRERTASSPYAEAFLLLADRLGLTDVEGGMLTIAGGSTT